MEYERTPHGQIQEAFARRAGQLVLQYEDLARQLSPAEQFESTLAVALLQSMLVFCTELLNAKRPPGTLRHLASRSLLDEPAQLGLDPACIVDHWYAKRGLSYRTVFEGLRNALSHPGVQSAVANFPRTGFTTIESGSGLVEAYLFTHAPWVNRAGNGLAKRFAPATSDDKSRLELEKAVCDWACNADVDGLTVEQNQEGLWRAHRKGAPFVPVLRLRLGVRQLRTLTLTLSEYLSVPTSQHVAVTA